VNEFGPFWLLGQVMTVFAGIAAGDDVHHAVLLATLGCIASISATYFSIRRWGIDSNLSHSPWLFWPICMPGLLLIIPSLERESEETA
jgi:hypothetical protein